MKIKKMIILVLLVTILADCFPITAAAEVLSHKSTNTYQFSPEELQIIPEDDIQEEAEPASYPEEERLRDSKDETYLRISLEKYGKTISASSIEGSVTVDVLEETKWEISAEFVKTKEGKKPETKNVTNKCTWSISEDARAPISFNQSTHTVYIMRDYGVRTAYISATYEDNDEEVRVYTAKFVFNLVHLQIPNDSGAIRAMSLSYLVREQWQTLVENIGRQVSYFVYQLGNTAENPINKNVKKNGARFQHLISEAAGGNVIEKCITKDGLRAVIFRGGSSTKYLVLSGSRGNGDNYEILFRAALEIYNDEFGSSRNVIVIGEGESGTVASYLSYMTGCQSLTFNAPSLMSNVFFNHRTEFTLNYEMSNKVNYILSGPSYEDEKYHIEPYYTVTAVQSSSYNSTMALLSGMIQYNPVYNSAATEKVTLSKSSLKRDPDVRPIKDVRGFYLGGETAETITAQVSNKQMVYGGAGNDTITLVHDPLGDVTEIMKVTGEVADLIANIPWAPPGYSLVMAVRKLIIDGAIDTNQDSLVLNAINAVIASAEVVVNVSASQLLITAARWLSGAVGVPMILQQVGIWLGQTIFDTPFIGVYAAGGKGNDVIYGSDRRDTYIYSPGDGFDTIYDGKGSAYDIITFYGCENASITWSIDNSVLGLLHIYVNGQPAIDFYIDKSGVAFNDGTKDVVIPKEVIVDAFVSRAIERVYNAQCPVDMLVYDPDGNLVQRLEDGAESRVTTTYGDFVVSLQDGEYMKTAILYDSSYRVELVGNGTGTMKYSAVEIEEETGIPRYASISDLTVQSGAVYHIPASLDDEVINVDWNGDGSDDEAVYQQTTVTLTQHEMELPFGEQSQVFAGVTTNSLNSDYFWISSDAEVVTVDENGVVSAVGFGEANVIAMSLDGTYTYDTCTVVVPEETISVDQLTVSGINESYPYTGAEIGIAPEVSYKGILLMRGQDYEISFSELVEPGPAEATITGMGYYSGEKTVSYSISAPDLPDTAEEKAQQVAAECRALGITGEYDTALWLHDWLTMNANYDYTFTWYSPEGVLLHGTGVCQSYATAYQLLLNEMGIENVLISSTEMDHAWNLVKIDGEWSHFDCTWDDPGTGGAENHIYFGMNDDLIARDHVWSRSSYTASTSLQNYYPVRNGELVFANDDELDAILVNLFTSQEESFSLTYIGADPDMTALSAFENWYSQNNWKYGIRSFSTTYDRYICNIHEIIYTEPWPEPVNKLAQPVDAPDFSMNSPEGNYSFSRYLGNGLVLIFGRNGCFNTRGLLERLEAELDDLHKNGIEVLISVEAAETNDDIQEVKTDFPSFRYCYEQDGLLSDYLEAVDYYNTYDTGWVTYPCVFIINTEGKITYYSTDYVTNLDELVSEAFAVSSSKPFPLPEENKYSVADTGDANLSDIGDGNVKRALQAACAESKGVFFLSDTGLYYRDSLMMDKWEDNYTFFNSLGFSFVACFTELSEEERQAYPHVIFVEYDENDPYYWDFLSAVNWDFSKPAYYLSSYFLESDGHIADYKNGATLSVWEEIIMMLSDKSYCYDMVLPPQLQAIEAETFRGGRFTSVYLGSDVRSIGSMSFSNCPNLGLIRLPDNLDSIDPSAFTNSGNVIIVCKCASTGARFAEENNIRIICR